MRRRVTVALVASLALVALAVPATSGAQTVTDKNLLETSVVKRVNAIRRNHGLRPLKVVPRLAKAADRHASSMAAASYFRHELYTPTRATNWTGFGTWIRWFWPGPGYSRWGAGENLAWGAPKLTAYGTVRSWMRSPGHRANILNPRWRQIGVGALHVHDPYGYYSRWDDVTIVAAEFGFRRR